GYWRFKTFPVLMSILWVVPPLRGTKSASPSTSILPVGVPFSLLFQRRRPDAEWVAYKVLSTESRVISYSPTLLGSGLADLCLPDVVGSSLEDGGIPAPSMILKMDSSCLTWPSASFMRAFAASMCALSVKPFLNSCSERPKSSCAATLAAWAD